MNILFVKTMTNSLTIDIKNEYDIWILIALLSFKVLAGMYNL